ncbi:hypothetical protein [Blastococcus sp. SYSU DS0617]
MGEPRPREVPGFDSARRSGLLPLIPARAPALRPGRSAQAAVRVFLGELVVIVVVGLAVVAMAGRSELSQGGLSVVVLITGLCGFVLVLQRWRQIGPLHLAELEQGYATLVLMFGGFTLGDGRRRPGMGQRLPWNYAGVWVLDSSGQVLSAPEPGVEGPGFYPSPTRPGLFELWTGVVWAGQYRTPRAHA